MLNVQYESGIQRPRICHPPTEAMREWFQIKACPKKRHDIWKREVIVEIHDHCGRMESANMCCICGKVFHTTTSTENLKSHVWEKHPGVLGPSPHRAPQPQSVPDAFSSDANFKAKATELLCNLVASGIIAKTAASSAACTYHAPRGDSVVEATGYWNSLDDHTSAAKWDAPRHNDFFVLCAHLSKGRWTPPAPSTITRHLSMSVDDLVGVTIRLLSNMDVDFAPTFAMDCWTSPARQGFYGQYLHFVTNQWDLIGLPLGLGHLANGVKDALVLRGHLLATCQKFHIRFRGCAKGSNCAHADPAHTEEDTVHVAHGCITDSGAGDPVVASMLGCNALRCAPHSINTVYKHAADPDRQVDDNLLELLALFQRVHDICHAYRKSNKLMPLVLQVQLEIIAIRELVGPDRVEPHVLTTPTVTRWGSMHACLSRFLEEIVQLALTRVSTLQPAFDTHAAYANLPTAFEIKQLREAVAVLSLMKEATVVLQGEKYVTLSSAYPYIAAMIAGMNVTANDRSKLSTTRAFARALGAAFELRLNSQFIRPASLVATYLDPRTKRLRTLPVGVRTMARAYTRDCALHEAQLASAGNDPAEVVPAPVPAPAAPDALPSPSWHDFGPDADGDEFKEGECPVTVEMRKYANEQPLDLGPAGNYAPDMSVDPLDWWKQHQHSYPKLARVARKFLGIPASAASSERMFSYTGNRVSGAKANLSDRNLLNLMLQRALRRFVDIWASKYY
jgi:hypothetical protein